MFLTPMSVKTAAACTVVAALVPGLASCGRYRGEGPAGAATELTVKGSDTMVHLVSAWAEAYMREHPATEISVTGGGSGTGFAALLNGTTDVCAASREMMSREREVAESTGLELVSRLVARDGVAVVVHPSNPVDALTIEQIRKIFTGAIDNWQQVGGMDREIVVFSRDTSSGTFVFFQEHVLLKSDFRPDARLMPATSAIVQSVAEDEGAIGYVGLGYATEAGEGVKMLAVSRANGDEPIVPSISSIETGEYAIARPLRLYTSGPPSGIAASFLDFCSGAVGQEVVRRIGYVPVE
jgi:phosphate transport system substrate-binding protein